MEGSVITRNLFSAYIAPHLDGRDACYLQSMNRYWRHLVRSNPLLKRRMFIHFISLPRVSLLPSLLGNTEPMNWHEIDESFVEQLYEMGYMGEGVIHLESSICNNFYQIDSFEHKDWEGLAKQLGECDLHWKMIWYPELDGVKRFRLNKESSVWRGGCVQVFYPISRKKRKNY